mmetsp:Transcript_27726/g.70655  ORF Transcript_27726/g.70655 Transcript_27726/m.70655 type:complete len:201 (+) Transcript_27726:811-1413(+)
MLAGTTPAPSALSLPAAAASMAVDPVTPAAVRSPHDPSRSENSGMSEPPAPSIKLPACGPSIRSSAVPCMRSPRASGSPSPPASWSSAAWEPGPSTPPGRSSALTLLPPAPPLPGLAPRGVRGPRPAAPLAPDAAPLLGPAAAPEPLLPEPPDPLPGSASVMVKPVSAAGSSGLSGREVPTVGCDPELPAGGIMPYCIMP